MNTFMTDMPVYDNDLSNPVGYICLREIDKKLYISIYKGEERIEFPIKRTNLISLEQMCQLAIACQSGEV